MSTTNKYFQDELTYLREQGQEFAREYPALASTLGQSSTDPDVERLLEGVAFLTGRVRQKLDDELPELIHSTASLLFPHLLRPTPAASILELIPKPQALRERRTVKLGSEFATGPIEGSTPCTFSTTRDCEVIPWTLEGTRLEQFPGGKSAIHFRLTLAPGLTLGQVQPSSILLHVVEEARIALLLTYFVIEHCQSISITAKTVNQETPYALKLSPNHIRQVGLDEDDSLLPHTEHVLPGFRLAQEYFILPQKFAFFEIKGLHQLTQAAPKATALEITIELDSLAPSPLSHSVSTDCLRLHCVPIINVFKSTAEPIRITPKRENYRVQPAALVREHSSVYSLLEVVGINATTERKSLIRPFFDYAHAYDSSSSPCYVTTLLPGTIGNDADLMICIDRPGSTTPVDVRTLSIALLATNGHHGSKVRTHDVVLPTSTSPAFAQFRNIVPATSYIPVPLGHEIHWRVTAHLATGLRTLADPDVLRAALRIYNLHGLQDRQSAKAHERRIDAIRKLSVSRAKRLYRGSIIRGIAIQIELDESGFAGDGDMYLFGAVLDRLFASYVPLNSFAVTTFTGNKERLTKTFPARSGKWDLSETERGKEELTSLELI